jgi:formyltetrahydrofolate hydrolase
MMHEAKYASQKPKLLCAWMDTLCLAVKSMYSLEKFQLAFCETAKIKQTSSCLRAAAESQSHYDCITENCKLRFVVSNSEQEKDDLSFVTQDAHSLRHLLVQSHMNSHNNFVFM